METINWEGLVNDITNLKDLELIYNKVNSVMPEIIKFITQKKKNVLESQTLIKCFTISFHYHIAFDLKKNSKGQYKNEEEANKLFPTIQEFFSSITDIEFSGLNLVHANDLFRSIFKYFFDKNLYKQGYDYFKQFTNFIKYPKFNSIQAFVLYFAARLQNYSDQIIQDLLRAFLVQGNINDYELYGDFCMFCFYKGTYFLEKRDYLLAAYIYLTSVNLAFSIHETVLLNAFQTVMIKRLFFILGILEYNPFNEFIKVKHTYLSKEIDLYKYLKYMKDCKFNKIQEFSQIISDLSESIQKTDLKGLVDLCYKEVFLRNIKDILYNYKRIRGGVLADLIKKDLEEVLYVLKEKTMEGKISVKYDEVNDVIEVIDLDLGNEQFVERSKLLYQTLLDALKETHISLKKNKDRNTLIELMVAQNKMSQQMLGHQMGRRGQMGFMDDDMDED